MGFLELTLPTIEENLALDEALLLEAEAGHSGELLRLWERPTPAIVLGSSGCFAEDVNESAAEADRVPIARRCSGGGTVVLGPGCLVFSLVLAMGRAAALTDVTHSYGYILKRIAAGLGEDVEPAGTSDLAVEDRKVSGNSQRRMRSHLLHHGTLLYALDPALSGRYLHLPKRQPRYRMGRSHERFLANLEVAAITLKQCLRKVWQADTVVLLPPLPLARTLVLEKYSCTEWVRRR